jgi:DNA-binding NarL/FixJ family response regulator
MHRMLVVADDVLSVQRSRFALRHAGAFRVVATLDGRASARAALARLRPEIVLVNELCLRTNLVARIREAREELPGATIVVVSRRRQDAIAAGADTVVPGDVRPPALGRLLREIADHDAPALRTSA